MRGPLMRGVAGAGGVRMKLLRSGAVLGGVGWVVGFSCATAKLAPTTSRIDNEIPPMMLAATASPRRVEMVRTYVRSERNMYYAARRMSTFYPRRVHYNPPFSRHHCTYFRIPSDSGTVG